jgi:ribonuclease-3
MEELEKKLGYTFRDKELLKEALTHSSWANENRRSGVASNERLEFLGDSVLGFTVAEFLYLNEPEMPEGQMTRLRAELVCEKSLENASLDLELGKYLCLGKGEQLSGGSMRPSILADAFEAVAAAVFLDGGIKPAKTMVIRFILAQYKAGRPAVDDYKTALQELVQRKSGQILSYHKTGESGPDHMKRFTVEVRLNDAVKGEGTGKSKKEAEQAAAKIAFEEMTK